MMGVWFFRGRLAYHWLLPHTRDDARGCELYTLVRSAIFFARSYTDQQTSLLRATSCEITLTPVINTGTESMRYGSLNSPKYSFSLNPDFSMS